MTRLSFKENNHVTDPRECVRRIVHEFVSGNCLDEKLLQDYHLNRVNLEKPEQKKLDLIVGQVMKSYKMREDMQNGRLHPRAYASAIESLLQYESDTTKKAA